MSRYRFPITDAVFEAFITTPGGLAHSAAQLQAPSQAIVQGWIAGLSDGELLTLRFNPGRDWCQQVRVELTRLTEETSR